VVVATNIDRLALDGEQFATLAAIAAGGPFP
jgi:hypothetical protein